MATSKSAAVSAVAAKPAGKAPPPPFPTSPTSPFPDKYDIDSERSALKDLVESEDFDRVSVDPRYPRYLQTVRGEGYLLASESAGD